MARKEFDFNSFLLRFGVSLVLVLLTYNPSGFSWLGWLFSETPMVYKVATGVVLAIGWVIFLRATWNSLGAVGTMLAAAFFAVIIWLLIEWGLLALGSGFTFQWVFLIMLSGVLALGMSWSHLRRRMSGQYDTDEIEG